MVGGKEGGICKAESRVKVLVVPTNEELMIARDTLQVACMTEKPVDAAVEG